MTQKCILTTLTKLKDLKNENAYNNFVIKAKTDW